MASDPVRILYIDDDIGLARLVEKAFSRGGWEVIWAPDAKSGLARLEFGGFDAIALDQFMPVRDGMDVLPELLEHRNAAPVVFCTGSNDGALAVAALRAGAADYVIKDASGSFVALLEVAIKQALETARLRKAHDAAEEQVRDARDRAEHLLREVDHRIGNSLQLLSSFVGLQARANASGDCKAALYETQRRIEAVAQVHKRLYTSDDVTSVDLAAYLEGLIDQSGDTLRPDGWGPTLTLETEPLTVSPDQTVSVGVIVTELITNAAKYAFVDREPGQIHVKLAKEAGSFTLIVADDGVGWDGASTAKGTGFGRRIIEAMTHSLQATLEQENTGHGLTVTVRAPLNRA